MEPWIESNDSTWYGNYVTITDLTLRNEGWIALTKNYESTKIILVNKGYTPIDQPQFIAGKGNELGERLGWKQRFINRSEFSVWLEDFKKEQQNVMSL